MAVKGRKLARAVTLGGIITAAPLIAACSSGPSYEDWAVTDGAAGRINLDDVQKAFKDSKSASDFETRVNEIYEGDGLIFIRASREGERLILEGWEDLNKNNTIEDAQDDLLFSIVKNTGGDYEMRGHHANGHYYSSFGAGNFLFTYLLLSSLSGPYFYHTPFSRGPAMSRNRSSYRQSSRYGGQVARNNQYTSRQQSFGGSRYQQSRGNISSGRQSYQQAQRASGGFKNSSSIRRSSQGSSLFGSGRGASGGGGSHVVLGEGRRRRAALRSKG